MRQQKLTRTNKKVFNQYYVYDATNNLTICVCASFKEARKKAFKHLKGQGLTVEIFGYNKNNQAITISREEDF